MNLKISEDLQHRIGEYVGWGLAILCLLTAWAAWRGVDEIKAELGFINSEPQAVGEGAETSYMPTAPDDWTAPTQHCIVTSRFAARLEYGRQNGATLGVSSDPDKNWKTAQSLCSNNDGIATWTYGGDPYCRAHVPPLPGAKPLTP